MRGLCSTVLLTDNRTRRFSMPPAHTQVHKVKTSTNLRNYVEISISEFGQLAQRNVDKTARYSIFICRGLLKAAQRSVRLITDIPHLKECAVVVVVADHKYPGSARRQSWALRHHVSVVHYTQRQRRRNVPV